jgi:[acyl-carrier-protein] S-malonyltransferase
MKPAAERLSAALEKTPIHAPRCTVVSNVTAHAHEAGALGTIERSIRHRLVEQLTSPVRWAESCVWLSKHHAGAEFHEPAPGKTLAGLMRRIDKAIKVNNHDEPGE